MNEVNDRLNIIKSNYFSSVKGNFKRRQQTGVKYLQKTHLIKKCYSKHIQINLLKLYNKTTYTKRAKDLNRYHTKEDIQMVKQHMQRCFTWWVISEITHLIEWLNFGALLTSNVRMWNNRNSHSLLVGILNGTDTLEDSIVISSKTQFTPTLWSSNPDAWHFLKGVENVCPHKQLHMDVSISFLFFFFKIAQTWT